MGHIRVIAMQHPDATKNESAKAYSIMEPHINIKVNKRILLEPSLEMIVKIGDMDHYLWNLLDELRLDSNFALYEVNKSLGCLSKSFMIVEDTMFLANYSCDDQTHHFIWFPLGEFRRDLTKKPLLQHCGYNNGINEIFTKTLFGSSPHDIEKMFKDFYLFWKHLITQEEYDSVKAGGSPNPFAQNARVCLQCKEFSKEHLKVGYGTITFYYYWLSCIEFWRQVFKGMKKRIIVLLCLVNKHSNGYLSRLPGDIIGEIAWRAIA